MNSLPRTLLCAWVLWAQLSYEKPGVVDPWQIVTAYETKAACDRGITAKQEVTRGPKDYGEARVRWACLPDTVRP